MTRRLDKVEEWYRARARAIITMINNLGGGSWLRPARVGHQHRMAGGMFFIFPARTIPFTEKAAKALNVKATKVLCNHGNRLRHSKTVGAFISGKHGGLGLRPVQSTMAVGIATSCAAGRLEGLRCSAGETCMWRCIWFASESPVCASKRPHGARSWLKGEITGEIR